MHQWDLNVAAYWLVLLFNSIVNNISVILPCDKDSDPYERLHLYMSTVRNALLVGSVHLPSYSMNGSAY